MITASQARSMAVSRWGTHATSARTNRRGAFYFSCSSHGGYIIDGRCLTLDETNNILKYLPAEFATEVFATNKPEVAVKFRGPDSNRNLTYYGHSQQTRQILIFYGEEDCAWSVIEKFTDIRMADSPPPNQTFWDWYDLDNPVVQERHRTDAARAATSQIGAYS